MLKFYYSVHHWYQVNLANYASIANKKKIFNASRNHSYDVLHKTHHLFQRHLLESCYWTLILCLSNALQSPAFPISKDFWQLIKSNHQLEKWFWWRGRHYFACNNWKWKIMMSTISHTAPSIVQTVMQWFQTTSCFFFLPLIWKHTSSHRTVLLHLPPPFSNFIVPLEYFTQTIFSVELNIILSTTILFMFCILAITSCAQSCSPQRTVYKLGFIF